MAAGPRCTPISIGDALFGRTRQAVLGLLFGRAGRSYHLREIVAVTGLGVAQIQRELAGFVECGLLIRTPRGNQVLYRANEASPVCDDVIRLVTGTFGLADILSRALASVADRIDLAAIVGPAARGKYLGLPDIDLIVVGALTELELTPVLREAERALVRRIAPTLLDRETFAVLNRNRDRLARGKQSAYSGHGPSVARALRALWTGRTLVIFHQVGPSASKLVGRTVSPTPLSPSVTR